MRLVHALAVMGVVAAFGVNQWHEVRTHNIQNHDLQINSQRLQHIMAGDATGGGHLYGSGKSCKTEFPPNWNAQKIEQVTERIAANDTIGWKRGKNGYYVGEQMVEGVKVRVVLGRDKNSIITAYPTNRPRNPCVANDN